MRKLLLFSLILSSVIILTGKKANAQISGDSLIWNTAQSGYDTIAFPVSGVYDMGSISYTDQITFLCLKVLGPVDTSKVPALYNTTTIGYMVFDTISNKWIFTPSGPLAFLIDTTYISFTFKDTAAVPVFLTLQLRFITTDNVLPVADSLKTTFSVTGSHNLVSPTSGVYNLGNFNETDKLNSLSIKIIDYDINTDTVYTTGSFSIPLHYNGHLWIASGIPASLPVGNDSLIAVFKDKSNNSISIKIIFSVTDNISPTGGKFIWYAKNTGKDSLNTPTANLYTLGNICKINRFISLNLQLNESNPDTNKVPLVFANDTIGWMKYDLSDMNWKCNDTSDFPVFPNGINNLTAKFFDKATPAHNVILTFKFTIGGVIPHVNLGRDSIICTTNSLTLNAGSGMDTYLWSTGSTTQTFIANLANLGGYGIHNIYITVTKVGCSGGDTIVITVNQTPTVTVSPSTFSICSGTSITMVASGANSYTWSGNSQYHFPGDTAVATPVLPSGGNVSIAVTGTTNGCVGVGYSNVTIKAIPNIGLGPDITITKDNDIYFGLTTGYTYLWSTGATTSNLYINGVDLTYGDTLIWVRATGTNGCYKIDTILITVNHGAGINSERDNNYIKIYPNPSDGVVNLEIENMNNDKISIEIYDILGNKVYNKNFENTFGTVESVDLSAYIKGVFFAKVFINNKIIVKKLILY